MYDFCCDAQYIQLRAPVAIIIMFKETKTIPLKNNWFLYFYFSFNQHTTFLGASFIQGIPKNLINKLMIIKISTRLLR